MLWILGMGGVWYTFQLGQIYTILLLLTTAAWLSLWKRKWVAAGIFIGAVCAVKPNFLVWPVLLVVGRSRKAGYAAIAATVALSSIPLISQGPFIFGQWITACRRFNGFELPSNSSFLAMFSRAGRPGWGVAITVLMLVIVTGWMMADRHEPLYISEVGILASLFAGPISWLGYTIMLIPVLYNRRMDTLTRIGCVILCIPGGLRRRWLSILELLIFWLQPLIFTVSS